MFSGQDGIPPLNLFSKAKLQSLKPHWKGNECSGTGDFPANQFGLKILVEMTSSPSSDPPVNIIFVHGLGGSATGTWTDPHTKLSWPHWLREVKGLENARIMTFGYDSDWNKIWKPNKVLDISDFAKQLAHDLWCHFSEYGDVYTRFVWSSLNALDTDGLCGSQYGRTRCQKGAFFVINTKPCIYVGIDNSPSFQKI